MLGNLFPEILLYVHLYSYNDISFASCIIIYDHVFMCYFDYCHSSKGGIVGCVACLKVVRL